MLIKLVPETVAEIRARHPDRWVALADPQRDELGCLCSGVVLAASPDQREVYLATRHRSFGELVYWHTGHDVPGQG